MGLADRILDGLKTTTRLADDVADLADKLDRLASHLQDLDRRLIRVETTLELATRGAFSLAPPIEAKPGPDKRQ